FAVATHCETEESIGRSVLLALATHVVKYNDRESDQLSGSRPSPLSSTSAGAAVSDASHLCPEVPAAFPGQCIAASLQAKIAGTRLGNACRLHPTCQASHNDHQPVLGVSLANDPRHRPSMDS